MSVHYRRRVPSRMDELGALSVAVLAGLGGAAAAYYLTRLFLSRERIGSGSDGDEGAGSERPRLPSAGSPERLPADGMAGSEG